jgi:hypothetical protein
VCVCARNKKGKRNAVRKIGYRTEFFRGRDDNRWLFTEDTNFPIGNLEKGMHAPDTMDYWDAKA